MNSKPISYTAYMQRAIASLKAEERFGTAHIYFYALRSYTEFVGGGEVYFGGLNRQALKRYEAYLLERSHSWNTVSTYVGALRAVYNRAVDEEIITGDYRLFSNVFTGVKVEKKRALRAEQMQQIVGRTLSDTRHRPDDTSRLPDGTHSLSDRTRSLSDRTRSLPDAASPLPPGARSARDLLTLMLLLQGMPFVDLIHLRKEDIKEDADGICRLSSRRRKTGTALNVEVVPEALELINRYRSTSPDSPYLLRFFDGMRSREAMYDEYRHRLRNLNYGLSQLSARCGLKGVRISSYTARHTWATLAKYCQVPEEIISEGLGHSSLKVTRTYLKSFEGGELARANRMVMACVFAGKKEVWTGS